MNLRTLLDCKSLLDASIKLYGATPEVTLLYGVFIAEYRRCYAPAIADRDKASEGMLEQEISAPLRESFRPLYDVFKPYMRDFIGKELPPLE